LFAFIFGTITANIYLLVKDKPLLTFEKKRGGLFTSFFVIAFVLAFMISYMYIAPINSFIGRTASLLYTPIVAFMIFCLVRYPGTFLNQFVSNKLFVKLGEASYSIYLLHAFFAWYARDYYYLKLNPWILYSLAILCILVMSRLSYLLFERPIQTWLRVKWMKNDITKIKKVESLPNTILT
jgi:peptidoglycan/LPS O-acetylase OafA/YrhL